MDDTETWKPVVNWEDCYAVSSMGRVRNIRSGRRGRGSPDGILKGNLDAYGYPLVVLSGGGQRQTAKVHRLVCAAFIGPCPDGMEVCHNDGVRTNNNLANLRYDSRSNNIRDAVEHGTHVHARKTHCKNGHELTPENATMGHHGHSGWRRCQACRRDDVEIPTGSIAVPEAAELLGTTIESLYVYKRRSPGFPQPTKIQGRLYFSHAELAAWQERRAAKRAGL